MKTDVDVIKRALARILGYLKKTYHVEKIGVFGSFSRGEDKKTSDVDILVEFSEPISMFRFIDLEEYLSKILGRKVDLVSKKALKPQLKEQILREVRYV